MNNRDSTEVRSSQPTIGIASNGISKMIAACSKASPRRQRRTVRV
jgi:hypothetical protein